MSRNILNDFEKIMAEGVKASADMIDKVEDSENSGNKEDNVHMMDVLAAGKKDDLPDVPPMDMTKMMDVLKETDLAPMLEKIGSNPEEIQKFVMEHMKNMSPEMLEKIKSLAMGGNPEQLMKEMQRKGLDPAAMKAKLAEQQEMLKHMVPKAAVDFRTGVLVSNSRQLKPRKLSKFNTTAAALAILKTADAQEIACSNLSVSGKTIKAWYNPNIKGINKRASKIAGFKVGGELLLIAEDNDLSIQEVESAESKLC